MITWSCIQENFLRVSKSQGKRHSKWWAHQSQIGTQMTMSMEIWKAKLSMRPLSRRLLKRWKINLSTDRINSNLTKKNSWKITSNKRDKKSRNKVKKSPKLYLNKNKSKNKKVYHHLPNSHNKLTLSLATTAMTTKNLKWTGQTIRNANLAHLSIWALWQRWKKMRKIWVSRSLKMMICSTDQKAKKEAVPTSSHQKARMKKTIFSETKLPPQQSRPRKSQKFPRWRVRRR